VQKLRNYVELSARKDDIPEPPPHLPHDLDVIATNYYNEKMSALDRKQNSEKTGNKVN
jgi:hypothetical protein